MESLKKEQQEIKKKYYFQKKKDQSEKMNEINEVILKVVLKKIVF